MITENLSLTSEWSRSCATENCHRIENSKLNKKILDI